MTRLLIAEDDPRLRRTLAISLKARHFSVIEATTGAEALDAFGSDTPDLVLLDLGLPDLDGLSVISEIRRTSRTPIIVVSARHSQSEKVDALEAGADDYVTKPFGLEELVARIRSALRRAGPLANHQVVTTPTFTLDFAAKTAMVHGEAVQLTPTEWRLVRALTQKPGEAVSSVQLLRDVWGPSFEQQNHYLRVYMTHVRKKLEPHAAHPQHFITVQGFGYRFQP